MLLSQQDLCLCLLLYAKLLKISAIFNQVAVYYEVIYEASLEDADCSSSSL